MIPNSLPSSLQSHPLLSQWVAFVTPGRVRVASGRVEIGQGVETALSQLAAEELDLEVAQVDLVAGDTSICPAEGWTSGSMSMAVGGRSVQIVCAEIRALFVAHVAGALGCRPDEITVEGGRFLRGGAETGHDYWSVAPQVPLDREVAGGVPLKARAKRRIVGQSFPRLDLRDKIAEAPFLHDIAIHGGLHARVLRQPWQDAELVGLDEDAVRKTVSGAVEIFQRGNFVAFLSASEFAAVRAAEAAREYTTWRGGSRVSDNVGQPDWLVRQPSLDNVVDTQTAATGDIVATVAHRFWRPFITYAAIGPSCAIAEYRDDTLSVITHSQGPGNLRDWLAKALDLSPGAIHVIHRQGAGAYGDNTADDAAFDAAVLALHHPGRPIRVLWSRDDEFLAAPTSPAMQVELRVGVDAEGRPQRWVSEIWSPPHIERPGANGDCNFVGAYALPDAPPRHPRVDTSEARHGGATRGHKPIYDIPHHRLVHHTIPEVALKTSSLRGLGFWTNIYAIEGMIDDLADRAGMDPVAYRLTLLSDPRARAVLEKVAEMSRWSEARRHEGTALGIGLARYKGVSAYCAVIAEVAVDKTVALKRVWCAADAGLVVNPDGTINQLEGGIIQGASFVLHEEMRYQDGQVATRDFDDYPILRFSEIPEVEVALVDAGDELPLGVGECSVGPLAGAVGNAVARALGSRVYQLPMTRANVIAALLG